MFPASVVLGVEDGYLCCMTLLFSMSKEEILTNSVIIHKSCDSSDI